jgi:glutamate-1-semialdehyde 2,1-aminomutase
MITVFFCAGPVTDYATAKASDTRRFARFFHAMLERGVYLPPAQFEAAFVSLAHTEDEIDPHGPGGGGLLAAVSRPA